MIKIKFELTRLSPCDALEGIAAAFSTTVKNDTIIIPPAFGEGVIHQKNLAKGISIFSWDIKLRHSAHLEKKAAVASNKVFNLIYILTPDFFSFDEPQLVQKLRNNECLHVLLDAVDRDLSFTLLKDQRIKLLAISMEASWLTREFEDAGVGFRCLLNDLIYNVQPQVYYRTTDAEENRAVKELHDHFEQDFKEPFYIKAKSMMLMSGFFHNLFIDTTEEISSTSKMLYLEKLNEVEAILLRHMNDQLPGIKDIAREVALSESSLKRYFKAVRGTSIYDYYLQKKMEMARQLLEESKMPVKEVAYTLGYERTSSFIRMFKKFYQLSPGFFHKARVTSASGA